MEMTVIYLLALLQLKHFVVDFLLQPKWMWSNKGTFLHPGGIAHAAMHALVTQLILCFFAGSLTMLFALVAFEFVAHYLIDYAKMNINRRFGYTPSMPQFYWLLGLDQFAHQLCYLAILYYVAL